MGAAHVLERLSQVVGRHTLATQEGASRRPFLLDQGQQQVLGGDIGVAHLACVVLGPVEHPIELTAEAGLRAGALLFGEAADLALHLVHEAGDVHRRLPEQRLHHALGLPDQRQKEVGVVDDWVAQAACLLGRVSERLLSLDCHPIRSDHHNLISIRGLRPSPKVDRQVPFPESLPEWQLHPEQHIGATRVAPMVGSFFVPARSSCGCTAHRQR